MKFKARYILRQLLFLGNETVDFSFNDLEYPIEIQIQKLSKDELKPQYKDGDSLCTTILEKQISEKAKAAFKEMGEKMHPSLKQLINDTLDNLNEVTVNTLNNLRWLHGANEPFKPIRFSLGYQWSLDGMDWKHIPEQFEFGAVVGFPIEKNIQADKIDIVKDLIIKGLNEPLSHELLSEAWCQKNDSPRSALVIGIAAAETGLKEFISNLMPDTKWLLANVQSPPLIRMLNELLPSAPAKNTIKGKVLCPPDSIMETLNKGVTIRNDIVHGKSRKIKDATIIEILKAVSDLLYLLDYYKGFTWAHARISIKTREELLKSATEE